MSDNTMANTQPVDITQQVTSQIPITQPIVKNPKRVAAGKANAEKRRQAREEQAKKIAEADEIIANENLRKAQEGARKAKEAVDPPVEMEAPVATPAAESQTLTTTQWLSIASIIVSLVAIYYKREEIKEAVAKIKAPVNKPVKEPVKGPVLTAPKKKKGIRSMD